MSFFDARRAEAMFREYRRLAQEYWASVEWISYGPTAWMAGPNLPSHRDTDISIPIRAKISNLEPIVTTLAQRLGVFGIFGHVAPSAAVGGPIIPFNLLACVIDQSIQYDTVSHQRVLDAIDNCIGAAGVVKRERFARLVKPWYWLVDVPALIVGWPFAVMSKAGVPDKVIDSTGAQIIKGLLTILLWLAGLAIALAKTGLLPLPDVLPPGL